MSRSWYRVRSTRIGKIISKVGSSNVCSMQNRNMSLFWILQKALHIFFCIFCILFCIFYCIFCILYYIFCIPYCIFCILKRACSYSAYCNLHIQHIYCHILPFWMHILHISLHIIHILFHILHISFHILHISFHIVHISIHIRHNLQIRILILSFPAWFLQWFQAA